MKRKVMLLSACMALITGTFAGAEQNLPVIAHWSFNDDKNILADSGPNHLDAAPDANNRNGKAVAAKGVSGNALMLDESASAKFFVPGKSGLLNLKPPYTICGWIMNTKKVSSSMCIFSRKIDAGKNGYDLRIGWTMLDYRWGSGGGDHILRSSKHLIEVNKWYHVALVNDGKTLKMLINAEDVAEQPVKKEDIAPADSVLPAVIGGYAGRENTYQFIGLIDELYIIAKALSADELLTLADYKNR